METESPDMRSFDYDLNRVIASKMEFVADGGSFLYLRKGEASGAIEVATYALRLLVPGIIDAGEVLAQIGGSAVAVAGGLAAFNKAWEFGLNQLDKFFSNVDRSKGSFKSLSDRLEPKPKPPINPQFLLAPVDMRVLCNRNAENERAIPLLHALGARLRHRPEGVSAGSHRYHVNDYRLALHFRASGPRFIGVVGKDPLLRASLKAEFLEEWERCGEDIEG